MNDATPRALIVDDDRSFQHGLAEVVEREGFKALTAGDLAEARAELAQGLPDAVLIDLNLPDGSGMELLDEFVWEPGLPADDRREIRRIKARVERERIRAGVDPAFHLKLGRGSLSDVEWTVQLLQLEHRVRGTGT